MSMPPILANDIFTLLREDERLISTVVQLADCNNAALIIAVWTQSEV